MDWIGNTRKFYVDANFPDYESRARAVARRFPHLRVGIGPAVLNDRYLGADRQQIEDFLQNEAGNIVPLRVEPVHAEPKGGFVRGATVSVNMGEIGVVEAKFVRALSDGRVVIDLDGIEDIIDASWISPVPPPAPEVPPAPLVANAAPPPAPEVPPAPPEANAAPPPAPEVPPLNES